MKLWNVNLNLKIIEIKLYLRVGNYKMELENKRHLDIVLSDSSLTVGI